MNMPTGLYGGVSRRRHEILRNKKLIDSATVLATFAMFVERFLLFDFNMLEDPIPDIYCDIRLGNRSSIFDTRRVSKSWARVYDPSPASVSMTDPINTL